VGGGQTTADSDNPEPETERGPHFATSGKGGAKITGGGIFSTFFCNCCAAAPFTVKEQNPLNHKDKQGGHRLGGRRRGGEGPGDGMGWTNHRIRSIGRSWCRVVDVWCQCVTWGTSTTKLCMFVRHLLCRYHAVISHTPAIHPSHTPGPGTKFVVLCTCVCVRVMCGVCGSRTAPNKPFLYGSRSTTITLTPRDLISMTALTQLAPHYSFRGFVAFITPFSLGFGFCLWCGLAPFFFWVVFE
jgi:hypothetical protein